MGGVSDRVPIGTTLLIILWKPLTSCFSLLKQKQAGLAKVEFPNLLMGEADAHVADSGQHLTHHVVVDAYMQRITFI